ncbi:hypothetical protein D3C87_1351980 [compost metagenome]
MPLMAPPRAPPVLGAVRPAPDSTAAQSTAAYAHFRCRYCRQIAAAGPTASRFAATPPHRESPPTGFSVHGSRCARNARRRPCLQAACASVPPPSPIAPAHRRGSAALRPDGLRSPPGRKRSTVEVPDSTTTITARQTASRGRSTRRHTPATVVQCDPHTAAMSCWVWPR